VSDERGSILLVGVGGQGVVLASAIVADTALRAGYDVKQSEVHGMSQRGGVVSSHLRYGPEVFSPLIEVGQADAVVALEWNEALRALPYLHEGAPLLVSLYRLVPPGACRNRLTGELAYPALALDVLVERVGDVRACDALAIAGGLGSTKAANSVLLGVLSTLLPFPQTAWLEALEGHAPRGTFAANERAFQAGRALVYPAESLDLARRAAAAHAQAPAPEAVGPRPSIEVNTTWCKGAACQICVRVCPERCLAIGALAAEAVLPEACTGCRLCELLCPDFAITIGQEAAHAV